MITFTDMREYARLNDQEEGAKPLDKSRTYDMSFFEDGVEVSRVCCSCPAKEVPIELRRLRRRYPDYAVTAVPNKTADEEFIGTYGIGIH